MREDQENPHSDGAGLSVDFAEPVYAVALSGSASETQLIVGSLNYEEKGNANWISLLEASSGSLLTQKYCKYHNFAPTKLQWHPNIVESNRFFASTADCLRIFKVNDSKEIECCAELKNTYYPQISAPYTSFDWSPFRTNFICCSSIDCTCTIWDVEQQKIFKQVMAHNKEAMDISFSKDSSFFATVGADRTLRLFDLRDLSKCSMIYEATQPLMRVAFNQLSNYIAITVMNTFEVYILDYRRPSSILYELKYHKAPVNAIEWSPDDPGTICSIGEDSKAHLWKLENGEQRAIQPLLEYSSEQAMVNLAWNKANPDLISIVKEKSLSIIKTSAS